MEASYSRERKSRIIKSFLFEPIPFDCIEVSAFLSTEEEPVLCGRLVRDSCRYEDYCEGLLDAFSEFGISLDEQVWKDEDNFKDFLANGLSRYRLRL